MGASRAIGFVAGAVARVAIVAGLLIGSFVAFELWGTSVPAAKAQRDLSTEWEAIEECSVAGHG